MPIFAMTKLMVRSDLASEATSTNPVTVLYWTEKVATCQVATYLVRHSAAKNHPPPMAAAGLSGPELVAN